MVIVLFWIVAISYGSGWIAAVPLDMEPPNPPGFDARYPEEVPGLFEGDIELPDGNMFSRNAIGDKNKRWPNGTIPFVIHSYFSPREKELIRSAVREIEENTKVDGEDCIKFINKTTETRYLFYATGSGCHSQLGFSGKTQGIGLGIGCRSKGTIIHETLHALGFYHEQSRPDRDSFVKVIMDNVQEKYKKNFEKMYPPLIDTQGLDYDYNSIMHYDGYSFGINRDKPTLVPLQKNVEIGQRYGMSQLDIVQLQRLYGCKERKLIKLQNLDAVSVNCHFERGICGWINIPVPSPNNNTWVRSRGGTSSLLTGPNVDHTFGSFEGYYLFTEASNNKFKVARIQTPKLNRGENCFTFWYHMKGRDMGSLNVYQVEPTKKITLFLLSGHQGSNWKQAKLNVVANEDTKIEFESVTGSHFRSDMAIDDIISYPGTC